MFTTPVPTTTSAARRHGRRRSIATALGLAGVVALTGACGTVRDGVDDAGATTTTPGSNVFQVVEGDPTSDANDTGEAQPDQPGGGGGGGGGAAPEPHVEPEPEPESEPEPEPESESTDPPTEPTTPDGETEPVMPTCDDVVAEGGALAVGPEPIVLEPGDMVGAVTVVNCTDAAVNWTGATVVEVALAAEAGTIEAGATHELVFTIDEAAIGAGPFEFAIKVSEGGQNTYVDVHAHRITNVDAGPGNVAPLPGTVTCADGCITAASVEQGAGTPDVAIAVSTNMPTALDVYLLTEAPLLANDEPVIFGLDPTATAAGPAEEHLVPLGGLTADTDYWVVIAARDEFGDSQVEWTSFHSSPPLGVGEVAGAEEGGCSASCITQALLSPDGAFTHLHVESHTPAYFWFWVSESPFPTDENDELIPPEMVDAIASNGDGLETTNWDATLTDLPYDTDLYVAIAAQDLNGGRSYHQGTYSTHPAPTVRATFETITVLDAGDGDGVGELAFAWGYSQTTIGVRAQATVASGETLILDGAETSFTFEHSEVWPSLRVVGAEEDPVDIAEAVGNTMALPLGWHADAGLMINEAGGGIYLGATVEGQADCAEYGVDAGPGARCVELAPGPEGDGYPMFRAVVSVEYVGA